MNGSQYKTQERQYSDVVSSQQGVEDTSAATRMQGNAQAVSDLTSVAGSVFESQKQAAVSGAEETYLNSLKQEALMREQGVADLQVANFRTKAEQSVSGSLSVSDRAAIRKSYKGLGIVDSIYEDSPETAYKKKVDATALEMGLDPSDPYREEKAANQLKRLGNLEENAVAFSASLYPSVDQRAQEIANSGASDADKSNQFAGLIFQVQQAANQVAMGRPEIAKLITAPYKEMIENYKVKSSSMDKALVAEAENRIVLAEATADWMSNLNDNSFNKYTALKSLGGPLVGALGLQAATLGKDLFDSTGKRRLGSPKEKKEIAKQVDETGARIANGTLDPTNKIDLNVLSDLALNMEPEDFAKLSDKNLRSLNRYVQDGGIEDLSGTMEVLSGDVGNWINNNSALVNPELLKKLSDNTKKFVYNEVAPEVQNQITVLTGASRGNPATSVDPTSVEVTMSGNRVVFTDPKGTNTQHIQRLNKRLSNDITMSVMSIANLTGEDPSVVLEGLKGPMGLLPPVEEEKAVESTTEAPTGFTESQMQIGSNLLSGATPTGGETAIPTSKVDWDFIEGREGFETKLYIPKKKGKVLGTSGVTVGMGIDLGTWGNKLEGLGVSPEIADKLKPYAGKKGEEADKFLKANPLELSEEEAREVSQKVKSKLLDEIKTQFNKDANNDFEDLTRAQQTVVASVFFQYGMDKTREKWAKNFWKQVTEGRWGEAKKNLANFGDDFQSRRDLELEYLED